MPASYPSSAKVFSTKSDGAGNTILAAHINDVQLEVTAIENDLINGLPLGRGGTGLTSLAANRVPYSSGSALTSAATLTFDGTTLTAPATTITQPLTISGAAAGQIVFPASQNASSNANTLDDYEEGTWTPVVTFATPGDLNVAYTVQQGLYTKIGRKVTLQLAIVTSAFTHTTAAGSLQITGVLFASSNGTYAGAMYFQGITKANYTQ